MKTLTTIALGITAVIALQNPANAAPNFQTPPQTAGKCRVFLLDAGGNPADLRPNVSGAGPAVVFFNPEDPLDSRVVGSKAFDITFACEFDPSR
jgi:hypothetical protein